MTLLKKLLVKVWTHTTPLPKRQTTEHMICISCCIRTSVRMEKNLDYPYDYDLRFTIYDLRFTIYDLRFTIYDLRFTITITITITNYDYDYDYYYYYYYYYYLLFTIYYYWCVVGAQLGLDDANPPAGDPLLKLNPDG